MSEISYAAAWARYRRIRLVTILLIVTFPVASALPAVLLGNVIGEAAAGALVAVLWIIATIVMAVRWAYFPCPRCGKKFRRKAGMHVRGCSSCGLLMFAESEAEAAPAPYPKQPELAAASADPTYAPVWKTYHHLQLLGSYWLLGGSILVAGIVLPQLGLDRAAGIIAVAWFVGWFLVFGTSRWRLLYFRCPRCKRRFHGGINVTKAEWCTHCRLRLYALSDPDAKTALR
jgi:hypothetical protein